MTDADVEAALIAAAAELRRLRGDFAALLGLVQGEAAGLMERHAEAVARNTELLEQVRERSKLITEQTATIRALKLALTREQARRLAPGAARGRMRR